MCGLVGFLNTNYDYSNGMQILQKMSDQIAHRGPNDAGVWFDVSFQIGLGHRRLSIMDLSSAASQPMFSGSGRYVIAFNGEIYNHLRLRHELGDNILWQSHSDTETLLAGFDKWGIQETVKRTIGMFAFAVWDKENQTLTLARDRLGEKPLFYGWQQGEFIFGSELKALRVHPAFNGDVNRDALALFMRHNTVPAPYSIWKGINKLKPGCLLTLSSLNEPIITEYWSVKSACETEIDSRFLGTPNEAVAGLENVLYDAIDMQMIADVPLGAFLSGGVDSSIIVALMQKRSNKPVRTFSIGFNEIRYNEAQHAKAVAHYLGTDHTELYVNAVDAMNVIPLLPQLYDEPFSDSSQIPTFLVSQLAKQKVTVALSGDGGDELFCGYDRYQKINQIWNKLSKFNPRVRGMSGKALSVIPFDLLVSIVASVIRNPRLAGYGDKLRKGSTVLSSKSCMDLYHQMLSHWEAPTQLVLGSNELPTYFNSFEVNCDSNIEQMMAIDMLTYLPDDILTKVDRAAMGVSLETRVPFLDHRVVEFACSLPLKYKFNNGIQKWVLREVLYKHVPKKLIDRPKMGFGIPIGTWLCGPLREWAEDLLSKQRLINEGFFQASMVRKKWDEHLSGRFNRQDLLWDVLMFQAWLVESKL